MHEERTLERRKFLKSGLLAASAAALGAEAVGSAQPARKEASDIPTRPFGKTGHTLPVLGMGGSAMIKLGKFAGYGVDLLALEERIAMVRHAFDKGVRYFDTARVYLESESIMGKGLKG